LIVALHGHCKIDFFERIKFEWLKKEVHLTIYCVSLLLFEVDMLFRAFAVCVFIFGLLLGWSSSARAEWSELAKEPEAQYFFDKESVTPVHVSRYAWVLTNLAKAETTPTGEPYASYMIRLRVYCKTDMVARLSISYFDKAMGKGKEVSTEDLQEWRNRETPIRPNTYMSALKKEVCAGKQVAG
jgi:hypothetical protein